MRKFDLHSKHWWIPMRFENHGTRAFHWRACQETSSRRRGESQRISDSSAVFGPIPIHDRRSDATLTNGVVVRSSLSCDPSGEPTTLYGGVGGGGGGTETVRLRMNWTRRARANWCGNRTRRAVWFSRTKRLQHRSIAESRVLLEYLTTPRFT